MSQSTALIEADNLSKTFSSGFIFRHRTQALREVSFKIMPGKTLAVLGESGCGKTTLARLAAGLLEPDSGTVRFFSQDITSWSRKKLRSRLQMVFQDADGSLNPQLRVKELLVEPLRLNGWSKEQAMSHIQRLLSMVGLTRDLLSRYPHEMSGGQRQRLGLARSMSLEPELIIADEPVASLDRSVQAHILSLLKDFRQRKQVSYLYISHDFSSVHVLADEAAIMLGGVFVEYGPVNKVFSQPAHPYTNLLIAAHDNCLKDKFQLPDIEQMQSSSQGCPFAPACPFKKPVCWQRLPSLRNVETNWQVRCHQLNSLCLNKNAIRASSIKPINSVRIY